MKRNWQVEDGEYNSGFKLFFLLLLLKAIELTYFQKNNFLHTQLTNDPLSKNFRNSFELGGNEMSPNL